MTGTGEQTAAPPTARAGHRTGEGASDRPPKLIVSDLDGTFLSPDGTVSPLNAEAVRAAEGAGITVMFATGRPIRWLTPVADLPGVHPLVIASNGAVLYDLARREIVDQQLIAVAAAADAVAEIRTALPDVAFGVETGEEVGYEEHYQLTHRLDAGTAGGSTPWVSRGRAEDLVRAGDFVKLLVQHPELSADALVAELRTLVGDRLTVTHSVLSGRALAEVSALGVSKATMLARHAARLGIEPADVAGFGDMPNDADLLGWVGRPHVMADAHPTLDGLGLRIGSNADSAVGRVLLGWVGR
ncbi:hypothetical protein FHX74_003424 [Friedmanniella endophytica]|uniref:Hydrolase n=1 Tax=Microlunatus kandeliicorticis TaxID=1759536 RepID=A0A7W3IV19_9ACTN|nr:HAD family hydrolase [Microlunatus kandeliicorticis]MBA8795783.1 hypothetical protein [Microlunatus kandeliicorticis]